jgi:hypothetical protein
MQKETAHHRCDAALRLGAGSRRSFILVSLLFVSVLGFTQQNPGVRVIGSIPAATDSRLYQIQVGAFIVVRNAEGAFARLANASLNPSYERYLDFTRVLVKGIRARDVPSYIDRIRRAGFSEVFVKIDPNVVTASRQPVSTAAQPVSIAALPVSTAALPSVSQREIAFRTIRVGETMSLVGTATNSNVMSWISSTPSTISLDSSGNIAGLKIGNGFIRINENEYISVVVVPVENFYPVPESEVSLLPENSKTSHSATGDITQYRTEPTFRLAYRFNNKGERKGASGGNGGIDILGRGPDYQWLWTTF